MAIGPLPPFSTFSRACVLDLGAERGAADVLANTVERFMNLARVSSRLRDHGVPRESAAELAGLAARQWTAQFNPRPVGELEFQELYEVAW